MGPSFNDVCDSLRNRLNQIEKDIRDLSNDLKSTDITLGDKGECIAQSMLALRDCESSRMRIGKVIQYLGDGISIYDK